MSWNSTDHTVPVKDIVIAFKTVIWVLHVSKNIKKPTSLPKYDNYAKLLCLQVVVLSSQLLTPYSPQTRLPDPGISPVATLMSGEGDLSLAMKKWGNWTKSPISNDFDLFDFMLIPTQLLDFLGTCRTWLVRLFHVSSPTVPLLRSANIKSSGFTGASLPMIAGESRCSWDLDLRRKHTVEMWKSLSPKKDSRKSSTPLTIYKANSEVICRSWNGLLKHPESQLEKILSLRIGVHVH